MRHGKKFNHLGRKSAHRKAMLSNMSTSLLLHKRITTTLAKAKELRKHVEPLVTRAKEDTTHNRRVVFSYLQNKEAIKILFGEVAEKVGNRPGGYTRIIKTGYRVGDNAEMCIIELVDFNELMLKEAKPAKKATRRSRRSSSTSKSEAKGDATTSVETEDKAANEDSSKSETKAKARQEQSEEPQAENTDKTEASVAEETESVKADDSTKAEAGDSPAQEEGDVNSDPKAEGDTPAKEDDGDQEKKPE